MTMTTPNSSHPQAFRASDHANDNKPHLLVCASGSVATIKIPLLLAALSAHPISIRVVLTPPASRFLQAQSAEQPSFKTFTSIPNVEAVYEDRDEWEFSDPTEEGQARSQARGWIRGDPILHIELRRWADMMLIAPLSANMLAKITGGMAEGLLCSVVRAWDTTGVVDQIRTFTHGGSRREDCVLGQKKRILVAPAMNTAMWRQPITARQVRILGDEWGVDREEGWFEVLKPMVKEIACGDVGDGAMMDWRDVVKVVETRLGFGE